MRITICELPHEPALLARAWPALCRHAANEGSELVLLPEFAFSEPVWQAQTFDPAVWATAEAVCERWLERLPELQVAHVVGTRPISKGGKPFNQGFLWSARKTLQPLRSKVHLPEEPGGWEARWFTRGDPGFPAFRAGDLSFGLSICTELWALENCASYAQSGVAAILSPRATSPATLAKWLALGTVVAARSGAYSLSSNRVQADGSCGGAGWAISPDGELLAKTSADSPFCTLEIDLGQAAKACDTYPRYVFHGSSGSGGG